MPSGPCQLCLAWEWAAAESGCHQGGRTRLGPGVAAHCPLLNGTDCSAAAARAQVLEGRFLSAWQQQMRDKGPERASLLAACWAVV